MASARHGGALRHIHRLFDEGTLAGLPDARLLERYVSHRDELAFEALVQRHGAMVMGVCRRVLDDSNDADDAFQAAFLLLARKAKSIWIDGSIGGWLHRVAWRIALQVKTDAARHRCQERRAAELAGQQETSGPPWDDTGAVLHQEIDRLPESYRKPIVLCYLEDMTCQQAASYLRWSEGTTRGRLARGKALLRDRLTRRGVAFSAASMGAGAAGPTASAASMELTQATVRAARQIALGEPATVGTISTASAALIEKTLRTMMITRLKIAAAAAIIVGTLTWVVTGLAAIGPNISNELASGPHGIVADGPAPKDLADSAKAAKAEMLTVQGRVLGPDGKPAAGAALFMVDAGRLREPADPVLQAKADIDGTFRLTLPKAKLEEVLGRTPWASFTILATADGLGLDWVELRKLPDEDLILKLVDDSVPISGRILDLQGRPIASVKVTCGLIKAEDADGIDPYLKLLHDDPMRASNHRFAKNYWSRLPGQPASVITDAEGRFRLSGIGRDRIVEIYVEGPTIQSSTMTTMTRKAATVSTPPGTFGAKTIYGASFDHLIAPGRALTGVVRDKRTKQPLVGVAVAGHRTNARAITDAEGRYTLTGFPKDKSYGLMVLAGKKAPYFVTALSVPDTAGLAPIQADVECVPGIPMQLKLTDKETGKPVTGADVFYWPVYPNSHVREVPGYAPVASGAYNSGIVQGDGTYLLGVLPGPGAVFVRTAEGKYQPACVDPDAFFKVGEVKKLNVRPSRSSGDRYIIHVASGEGYGALIQDMYSAIILVNPADATGPLAAEAVLERDRKRKVRVVGPDGEPLAGVTGHNHAAPAGSEGIEATKTPGVLAISRLNPLRPKRFIFRHDAKKLVGFLVARGDEAEPYTVKLQPWGTITGRLVDAQGKPRPGVGLLTPDWQAALINPALGVLPGGLKTDSEGRFRVEGLVPGQEHSGDAIGPKAAEGGFGVVIDRVALTPGETRDLGDCRSREIQRKNTP